MLEISARGIPATATQPQISRRKRMGRHFLWKKCNPWIWYLTPQAQIIVDLVCNLELSTVQISISFFLLNLYFGFLGITVWDHDGYLSSRVVTAELLNARSRWYQTLSWSDLALHALVHVFLLMFNLVLQSSACMSHLLWRCRWSGAHSSHPYGQWVGLQCLELSEQILVDVSVLWIFLS